MVLQNLPIIYTHSVLYYSLFFSHISYEIDVKGEVLMFNPKYTGLSPS
jgi:hypothetical protein